MTTQDRIEREITIDAPPERVWTTLTEPEHVGVWFGDAGAEIDLRPGGEMRLSWKEHGTAHARVERVEPPRFFSYRWALDHGKPVDAGNSTLVEFTLSPAGDGTLLRVLETGFATLDVSEAERARRLAGNVEGWQIELGHLRDHVMEVVAR